MNPRAQAVATVVPAGQYCPVLQATRVAGVVHAEPAEQIPDCVLPAGQYWPAMQSKIEAIFGQ